MYIYDVSDVTRKHDATRSFTCAYMYMYTYIHNVFMIVFLRLYAHLHIQIVFNCIKYSSFGTYIQMFLFTVFCNRAGKTRIHVWQHRKASHPQCAAVTDVVGFVTKFLLEDWWKTYNNQDNFAVIQDYN